MPSVRFVGSVFPKGVHLSVQRRTSATTSRAGRPPARLFLTIRECQIDVGCGLVDYYNHDTDFEWLAAAATQLTRSALACISFGTGMGLNFVLDEFITPEGLSRAVLLSHGDLSLHVTAFDANDVSLGKNSYAAMMSLVTRDPSLARAMDDLAAAISVHGLIQINSARAIESLRHSVLPNDLSRTAGWTKLREVLNLERSYIEFITANSTGSRHGADRLPHGYQVQAETLEHAWIIMNRFLEYRKRGSKPLPLSEFPVLT